MKEINPADVPQLVKDGKIEIGTILEFSVVGLWTSPGMFYGVNLRSNEIISEFGYHNKARFPLPKLRDGDPVVVWNYGGSLHRRHVKGFEHALNGKIATYPNGLSLWSDEDCDPTIWDCWRLPTKEELSRVGCSEAQITEMFNRWGVSGTTRVG